MLEKIQLIKNVGRYEQSSPTPDFGKLTLVYSENGRGKTTLCGILRSLSLDAPHLIHERKRLNSKGAEKVVLTVDGNTHCFESGSWNGSNPPAIMVFDEQFVDENVYSGLSIASNHRKNLHEIVLGADGVSHQQLVVALTDKISVLQRTLKDAEKAINADLRGDLSVEAFCQLERPLKLDEAIENAEKTVAVLAQSEAVIEAPLFEEIAPPQIDIESFVELLRKTLSDVHASTVNAVQEQFSRLGASGEKWVSSGIAMTAATDGDCPFCDQPLSASKLFSSYEQYFSEAYKTHVDSITAMKDAIEAALGADAQSDLQLRIARLIKQHAFWNKHTKLPSIDIDSEQIEKQWKSIRSSLKLGLDAKRQSPLAAIDIANDAGESLEQFNALLASIKQLSDSLVERNVELRALKERAKHGSYATSVAELQRLQTCKRRLKPDATMLCDEYLAAKAGKQNAEAEKVVAKEELTKHRDKTFPDHQTAINKYLLRFNAGFTIEAFQATDPRGQPSSDFLIGINDHTVSLSSSGGNPSFKTALSTGDRNTLALAFFFSMLEQHPSRQDVIVVVDDPASSLDEGRMIATAQEIRSLCGQVRQVIVTAHSKPLLCEIFEHAKDAEALRIYDSSSKSSNFSPWDVTEDSLTEYDRRHRELRKFVDGGNQDPKKIAESLRPLLESFLRTACVSQYSPGKLLGNFVNEAKTLEERGTPIMSSEDLEELEKLKEYGNRFHHDNAGWQQALANLNVGQLRGYGKRTLAFTNAFKSAVS